LDKDVGFAQQVVEVIGTVNWRTSHTYTRIFVQKNHWNSQAESLIERYVQMSTVPFSLLSLLVSSRLKFGQACFDVTDEHVFRLRLASNHKKWLPHLWCTWRQKRDDISLMKHKCRAQIRVEQLRLGFDKPLTLRTQATQCEE